MNNCAKLVRARKECTYCIERNPGRIRNPSNFKHDPDVISHWAQWLGHHKPKIVVIGQDFGNVEYFIENEGKDSEDNITNQNLRKFLNIAGFYVGQPSMPDPNAPIFLANSIYCAKEGEMNAPILTGWVNACVEKHLTPLMRYLKAPIVVGMGASGWRAARRIFSLTKAPLQISEAAGFAWYAEDGTHVFAVGHCSGLGLVNRPRQRQAEDWRRIGQAVSACSNGEPLTVPNSGALSTSRPVARHQSLG